MATPRSQHPSSGLLIARKRVIATLVATVLTAPAMSADRTWFGANGDWDVAGNWLPSGAPGLLDRAIQNAGNAGLSFDAVVGGFDQGGGALIGSGNLSVSGASVWTGGTLSGAAAATFANELAISGPAVKTLHGGRTLNLQGTTTWSGNTADNNNAIRFWNGGTLNNSGTFNDANAFASFIEHFAGGPHAFNNAGTYNKQSNTITTIAGGVAFNNTGTVNVNAGTLRPTGGTSSGTFNIASGATLDFRNGNNTLNNVTTSGAGTFQISSDNVGADAVVTVNGGTHTTPFVLSGSTLAGTSHTFQGLATWSGGTISGDASTSFSNDVTISGAATKTIHGGRVVNLQQTTTWSGNTANNNNAIQFWNGGTLNNSGTFNDANAFDSFIEHSVGGPHNFNNTGTYNKQSNTITTTDLGVAFNNTGTVNVNAGTLRLGGGTSNGTFNIAAGAALEFRNGNSTLDNAITRGAGTLIVSTDNVGADAILTVNGGAHTTALVLSGSALTGSNHAFQGPVTWSGGSIAGAASTTFSGNVAISGPGLKTMVNGRTLNLNATTTWSGNTAANNNTIRFWNGATLNNNGVFVDANAFDSFVEHNVGGPHHFNNAGTYNKTGNATTLFDLGVTLNNTGTVNVDAGTIQVSSAMTNEGLISIAAGAVFRGNNATFVNAGLIAGNGTIATHANGNIVNQGIISPGMAAGTAVGQLALDGTLTQMTSGSVVTDLASLASFDILTATNDVLLDGMIVARNAGYDPVVGDTFVVLRFDERLQASTFDGVSTIGYGDGVRFEAIYNLHDVTLTVAAVPEPQTYALFLAGLGAVAFAAKRRRRA